MITLILGAVASLRGYVGTDTFEYHLHYELIKGLDLFDKDTLKLEPAYLAIGRLVELFGGDSFAYVSFIGILQTLLLIFILRRLERPSLFLIFYIATFYLNFHFNILRQATSLLLIMIALTGIKEGGWKFFIPLFASIFFHYSSILFVPYVLLYKQLKERQYVSLMLLTPIILALSFGIITLLADVINEKSSGYGEETAAIETKFGTGIGFLLNMSLYVGLAATLIKGGNKLDAIFFVLPLILIKILIIPYPLLGRVEIFFSVSFLLLLTIDAAKGWQGKLSSVIMVVLSLSNVYGTLRNTSEGDTQLNNLANVLSPYVPYHTLFGEADVNSKLSGRK